MDAFEAIADPVRRSLLTRLASGTMRVVDLAAAHEVTRPAISRHLRVLGEAGLVIAEERGRERHYRLVPHGLAGVETWLAQVTRSRPPVTERVLDGLDLEVRRTVRDHRAGESSTSASIQNPTARTESA